MALSYDRVNKIITVLAPDTEITIQNLLNSIRVWEAELTSMDMKKLVSCAGKELLGGGVSVGLTLTLLNDWRLAFEARTGPDYIQCKVSGGNIVATNINGSIYPTAFTQVLITASSSATQSELSAIQYSSYQNAIWVDVINGSPGTKYPIGTSEHPVNNIQDATSIGLDKGFSTLQILNSITIGTGDVISNFKLIGVSQVLTTLTLESAADCTNIQISNCHVTGVLDGGTEIDNCIVEDLVYFNGHICNSGLSGSITLAGGHKALFAECKTIDQDNTLVVDMGSSGQSLAMPNYAGIVTIKNLHSAIEEVGIGLNAGRVIIESTVTAGSISISGNGDLIHTQTGTELVDSETLISAYLIATTTWNTVYINPLGQAGTDYPIGTERYPSNNFTDALLIAQNENIHIFNCYGSIQISETIDGYSIYSNNMLETIIDLNNQSIKNTIFKSVTIIGVCAEQIHADKCIIGQVSYLCGSYNQCTFTDHLLVSPTHWLNIYNGRAINDTPLILDMNNTGKVVLTTTPIAISVINMTDESSILIKHGVGDVSLDNSNTAGNLHVAGEAGLIDNGFSGLVVNNNTTRFVVWDEAIADHTIDGSTSKILTTMSEESKRLLGLLHENIFIDSTTFDENNNLVSARVRIYDNSNNVGTINGIIGTYKITSNSSGTGKFTSWSQVRLS